MPPLFVFFYFSSPRTQDSTYVKLVSIPHQRVVQQMPIYLRLDQDQVDEQDDVVMLDIFVAEAAAVLADREADVVAARPRP